MRKFLNLALVLLLTITAALAQQPSAGTPSINRLQQIIAYLASDALEGRRTGSPGANDAAHYIAGEFSLLGLRPGMQMTGPGRTRGEIRARYLQPFPYVASVELGKNNSLTIVSHGVSDVPNGILKDTLRIGQDWMPIGFSTNANVESDAIIFCGYGISAPELKHDDYAGCVPKNRAAIVFEGTPDGDNPHGQFVQAGQIRFKAAAARAAGARALIVISSEQNLKDERLSNLSYDNVGGAGIPVIVVSRKAATSILRDVSHYEKVAAARTLELPIPEVVSLTVDVVRRESPSFNVVGILPGTDPKLKNETIVIGAHYDHLGMGGEGSGSLSARTGIHHGADDNASGVAGLLELARIFTSQGPKPRRTIVFIAFSGEEEGLIGSSYYVNHPIVPLANTVAMINMDMIGRLKEKKLIVGGVGTAQEWRSMIDTDNSIQSMIVSLNTQVSATTSSNFPIVVGANGQPVVTLDPAKKFDLTLNEDGYGPSDHSSFYSKQVPVLFFWTGNHEDYHKPSDTADKINYEGEARVISFVANVVRDIDKSDKRPTYTVARSESQGRSMGFRVSLGTIPNYADTNDGLKLDGVRDDSPAAKAGLKAGDRVVKMAGREVKNVYDYTYALGEMKAGQEYEVEVMRGSERLTLKITPAVRK
jgi:aminopeptidase YwaD